MYAVVIPILWDEKEFQSCGFEDSKPLINVLGKPMIEKFLESFRSNDFKIKFFFIVNKDQLTDELEIILNKYGEILKKTKHQNFLNIILTLDNKVPPSSKLIIANFSQYIDWNMDEFLHHCNQYNGCLATFYSINKNYSYIKKDIKTGLITDFYYKPGISNSAICGIYYYNNIKDFSKSSSKLLSGSYFEDKIFSLTLIYRKFIEMGKSISNFNIEKANIYPLNSPLEFMENIQKLKKRYL